MPKELLDPAAVLFIMITIVLLLFLVFAVKRNRPTTVMIAIVGSLFWLFLQSFLSITGVYRNDTDAIPPKIVSFGIFPMLFLIVILFISKKGRWWIDALPLKALTYLHVIRIPVEVGLYLLYLNKLVPQLMTFEGRNFDILAGVTAPIVAHFFVARKSNPKIILVWNFVCLALLLNVVIIAFLSAPSPLQKLAFEQPNVAILHFPFVWLPTFIVPVVLFAHLVTLRKLLVRKLVY
ncbi:hypothetical protein [Pedobacter xixiisoli]|uniref:Uncharacterized protein n=1 Tax=Pedobacter xixiisoli TaxID=1476464 RepID=A0A285ZPD9_9SPHI|nr:hypothetical protein [Pedobacter xixiisoli]SOD11536.1 hypothetical protein SAMN06297358_0199 [Pedobacter xixiisoli]